MKYNNLKVVIPYYDLEQAKSVVLSFSGKVDRRRVKREIRKYCKRAFNKVVPTEFIKYDCQYFLPNEQNKEQRIQEATKQIIQEHNELLRKLQLDEQTETNTSSTDTVSSGSESNLPLMSN